MRAPVRLLAVTLLTVAAATACGGGSKTDATTNAAAAGESAQEESMEDHADADPDADKIPHGTDLEQAEAAGLGTDGAPVVSVVGTDTECTPDVKSVKAGKIWVKFTNSGTKVSEVYLESSSNEKLAEVENITAGKSGGFSFTVEAGNYQLSCVPGMNDNEIRVPLEVTS